MHPVVCRFVNVCDWPLGGVVSVTWVLPGTPPLQVAPVHASVNVKLPAPKVGTVFFVTAMEPDPLGGVSSAVTSDPAACVRPSGAFGSPPFCAEPLSVVPDGCEVVVGAGGVVTVVGTLGSGTGSVSSVCTAPAWAAPASVNPARAMSSPRSAPVRPNRARRRAAFLPLPASFGMLAPFTVPRSARH